MNKIIVSAVCACLTGSVTFADKLDDAMARARKQVGEMTLEEKAGELMLYDYGCWKTNSWEGYKAHVDKNQIGALMRVHTAAETRKLQQYKIEHSRLKIPMIFHDDITSGCRTLLPLEIAVACSWDEDLCERAYAMVARETTADGIAMTYSPTVDVSDDPRWGRINEICGEDPYLVSRICAAKVRGFQGKGLDELTDGRHIIACDKHFAGYASLQAGKDYRHRDFSRRELYETYLPPHRACIEAGALAVMCAYTAFDGVPCSFSRYLLTDILRGELGFRGQLITDWTTFNFAVEEGASGSLEESAVRGIGAGADMDMISDAYLLLPGLVRQGKVREEDVDTAVARSLALKYLMGLFDDPYRFCDEERERSEMLSDENRRVALEMTRESMVLLENDGTLPLPEGKAVALTGRWADDGRNQLSYWKAFGSEKDSVTVKAGMAKRWGERLEYVTNGIPKSDTVVLAIGEHAKLSGERKGRADIRLPEEELETLRRLSEAGKKVVSVVFAGRPIDMREIKALSAAVLYVWYPGTMGGEAIAEVLSGEVNPSGKLCVTFPRTVGQIPITYREKRTFISCGYSDVTTAPLYPFGYGKSYTEFRYSNPYTGNRKVKAGESVTVAVDVTNVGTRTGREIVQLYVRDEVASVLPRERELKAFKTVTIRPGETKHVTLKLDESAFALYDANLRRVVEPGEFTIFVGPDATTSNSVKICVEE